MRKINSVISMALVALFLIHAVAGGFMIAGIISIPPFMKAVSWTLAALTVIHIAIGIKLTADTLIACKKSGVSYFKENKLFWARRISGFAAVAFMIVHVLIFNAASAVPFRLNYFGELQLVSQILMVIAVAVHVITNVNPLIISLGIKGLRKFAVDILVILAVILLFAGIAFIIYYLRWNTI